MTLVWLALALAPLTRLGDPATPALTPGEAGRARLLVRQLGNPVYREREAASRELAKLGASAVAALGEAEHDPDAEVRARVGQLLPRARTADTDARLRLFLLDWAGRYEHGLPGWALFASVAGDTPAARELFADIYRVPEHRPLLAAIENAGPLPGAGLGLVGGLGAARLHRPAAAVLEPLLRARRAELVGELVSTDSWLQRHRREMAETALVLFAETFAPPAEPAWPGLATGRPAEFLASRPSGDRDRGAAFPVLFRHWAAAQTAPSALDAAMSAAEFAGLDSPAICVVAARVLAARGSPMARARGAEVVARHGTMADLPALVAAFGDCDVAGSVAAGDGVRVPVRVGHAALAHAILLAKWRPRDFGFSIAGDGPAALGHYFPLADAAGRTQAQQFAAAKLCFRAALAESHGAAAGPGAALASLLGPAGDFGP